MQHVWGGIVGTPPKKQVATHGLCMHPVCQTQPLGGTAPSTQSASLGASSEWVKHGKTEPSSQW